MKRGGASAGHTAARASGGGGSGGGCGSGGGSGDGGDGGAGHGASRATVPRNLPAGRAAGTHAAWSRDAARRKVLGHSCSLGVAPSQAANRQAGHRGELPQRVGTPASRVGTLVKASLPQHSCRTHVRHTCVVHLPIVSLDPRRSHFWDV